MIDREKVINGLECCLANGHNNCPYESTDEGIDKVTSCTTYLMRDALALLKAQQSRVMTLEEVTALPYGYVLIETDKEGSLRWVDALLFCKNTNFSFDFITLEGRARLLGTEYNKEWRCWTDRPTAEQREAEPWKA